MNKNKIRNIPEIMIAKGYEPEDFLDTDDNGYDHEEPILTEEVILRFERD